MEQLLYPKKKFNLKRILSTLLVFFLVVGIIYIVFNINNRQNFSATKSRAAGVDLNINFNKAIGPAKMEASGLEWIFPMSNPEALKPFVVALKPYSIKDPWGDNLAIAKSMNPRKIQWLVGNAVVSQGWYPWQDYGRWTTYVKNYVSSNTKNGENPEWIIWQEPDSTNKDIWVGTREQFFETWKIAYQTIRSTRPNDVIIGPSPEKFNVDYLKAFLLYAKQNNVMPDVLSWHETFGLGYQGNYTPDLIPQHKNTIVAFMKANNININRFEITEYGGLEDDYKPGIAAAFLADLEASQISGTRGNWGNGDEQRISGLVTDPKNPQPRSIWWIYKHYAEMTGNIYTTTFATSLNGFGTYDPKTQIIRVLAGNQGGPEGTKSVLLSNIPSQIAPDNKLVVRSERIMNSNTSALTRPQVISAETMNVVNNNLLVSVPSIGKNDALYITAQMPPQINVSASGNSVTVNFSQSVSTYLDWIGIFKKDSDDNKYVQWKWLNDSQNAPEITPLSGKVTFPNIPKGEYEVRYIFEGTAKAGHKTKGQVVTVN